MQPVVRALAVLRALGGADSGATLQELSDRLEIPLGSMHRLLGVMCAEGFITRSKANKRYFLGPGATMLSGWRTHHSGVIASQYPGLRHIVELTGETVFVTVLSGGRAVCVQLIEGHHALRLFVRIGQEMPLHAAASARVLLSEMEEAVVEPLLSNSSLTRFQQGTPSSVEAVCRRFRAIRARGYDVCHEELDHGVWAVAAPIRDGRGEIVASVTLAGPSERLRSPSRREEAVQLVVAAAREISQTLGYEGFDPGTDGFVPLRSGFATVATRPGD